MSNLVQNKITSPYPAHIFSSVLAFAILTIIHSWLTQHRIEAIDFIVPVFAGLIVGYLLAYNRALHNQLTILANTDKLTSACNRQYFDQHFSDELERAQRYHYTLSIIYIDLDHFKQVNDNHGHKIGDSVLIDFSRICHDVIRESDVFARFGGEEFIVLAPMTNRDAALQLYQRIRDAVKDHSFEVINWITFSAGIAEMKETDRNIEQILIRADKALYQAKENGRDQAVVAD